MVVGNSYSSQGDGRQYIDSKTGSITPHHTRKLILPKEVPRCNSGARRLRATIGPLQNTGVSPFPLFASSFPAQCCCCCSLVATGHPWGSASSAGALGGGMTCSLHTCWAHMHICIVFPNSLSDPPSVLISWDYLIVLRSPWLHSQCAYAFFRFPRSP